MVVVVGVVDAGAQVVKLRGERKQNRREQLVEKGERNGESARDS